MSDFRPAKCELDIVLTFYFGLAGFNVPLSPRDFELLVNEVVSSSLSRTF